MSETRVVKRAEEGGHFVDPFTVASNFYGNLEKLDQHYPIFHSVAIFDTSGIEHIELAFLENGFLTSAVMANEIPFWFTNNLPGITALVTKGNG